MAETIKIGGELESTATGNVVAAASAIKDKVKNKYQSEINAETDASLADRYTKAETYNKTELNNMITTPNQQYVSVTANSQTAAVTDVLPATGEANTIYRVGNWDGSRFDASVYSEYAWNGSSYVHLNKKTQAGEVFDISVYHATGSTLATYADLSAALDSNNGGGVPQSLQRGGMSIKFVQSSDNKYVQYRLMSDTFNTTVANWQGEDSHPTADSLNFVTSNGVFNATNRLVVINGKYIASSGEETESNDWGCTEFIKLNGITTLKWKSGTTGNGKLVLYNANKEYIEYYSTTSVNERVIDISSYTTAVYVRASFYLLSETGYYLKDNNNQPLNVKTIKDVDATPTEGSHNLIESNAVYQEGKRVENLSLQAVNDVDDKTKKNKADFDGETLLKCTFEVGSLNSNGEPVTNNIRIRSNLIGVVKGGKILRSVLDSSFVINSFHMYDDEKNYIGQLSFTSGEDTEFVLDENAAYIRITMRSNPDGWNFANDGIPDEVYYSFKLQQESLRNINLYNSIAILQRCGRTNRNYVSGYYINSNGLLIAATGVNVSKLIPVVGTTFTWNFGSTAYTNTWKVCVFDAFLNLLDFWTITGGNTRTIDFSNKEYAANAKYIVASFGDDFANASIVQGTNTWKPSEENVPQNIIEYLDVCTYNVGAYRRNAAYMSEEDKVGFLRQLKEFMNGKINKDIMFTQEEVNSFIDGSDTINTYETYYRQFYPYKFICRGNWSCIYSKYPLKNCREFDYTYTPSGGTEQHRYHALAEVEINGKTVGLASVHCNFYSTEHQAEFEAIIAQMAQYDYAIIAGDFNLSNSEAPQSDIGSCPIIENTFEKAGYQSANWAYWGNIHTQTDVNAEGQVVSENQIDTFLTKGFAINSFDVLPVAYYDHMPCISKLNFV